LRMDGDRQELRYSQSIVQQALLRALRSKPWFRRVQRALLDTVASSGEGDAEASFLAAGYEGLGAQPEAVLWLKKGIARAFATGTFDEVIDLAGRLAKIAKSPSDRARAEVSGVEALFRLGRAKEAREKLEPVLATVMPGSDVAAEARILALSIAFALGDASEDADSGLIADADACSNPRIGIEARLSLATSMRGKRGLELVDEALRRIRAVPEDQITDLHYRLLTLRFEILWESRLGDANERSLTARRAADAARALGSEWAVLDMDLNLAVLESDQGRDDAAIAILEGVVRRASERHFVTLRRQALTNMATIKLRSGRAAEAAEAARDAANAAREAGNKGLVAMAQSIRAAALSEMGDMINARAAIEESVELKLAASDANVAVALLRRADIYNATGEAEKALADAELALARATQVGHPDQIVKARIWMAVNAVKSGAPNARENLREVLTSLEPVKASLVVSTRRQIAEAEKLLEVESEPSARSRGPGS
ncbi:MAG TPA: hypothetical protein VK459_05320, partial [Polyangiaceae bacterium]|nr:hypothetical protein [Polyangiaceae bacterium]